jgi:hypothetical protein
VLSVARIPLGGKEMHTQFKLNAGIILKTNKTLSFSDTGGKKMM